MPLYEFACLTCHHEFEALVRGTDTPRCPACGGAELARLLSAFAVKTEATTKSAFAKAKETQKKANQDRIVAEREQAEHHHH